MEIRLHLVSFGDLRERTVARSVARPISSWAREYCHKLLLGSNTDGEQSKAECRVVRECLQATMNYRVAKTCFCFLTTIAQVLSKYDEIFEQAQPNTS
ncbi:hypothetical protein HETIRDRAFT_418110 [Heterobasidion irregulare TC 32-1]|uniref:Uncharacterized protein n=1 Tax=Heterobasidion irregulare (strain TC 32-1) TaxID=747525 RepID=W4KAQ0_HETIT|nr:uncharacterized protein HETIRDRAFT_418110 [Heterobasidion irregulare TC 32-1]ETW82161.1 hypothetical protein HETIRDRAFT_418110 [Heterobasidion irregulare TC 32-1]